MACAGLIPGERVLDVACGTALPPWVPRARVSPAGEVIGVDLSNRMVEAARQRAMQTDARANVRFEQMDAEKLELPDNSFDVALCALGLMYIPNPEQADPECVGSCATAAASFWRSGASVPGADGRSLYLRLWMPKSTATSARCFSAPFGTGRTLADVVCSDAGFDVTTRSFPYHDHFGLFQR